MKKIMTKIHTRKLPKIGHDLLYWVWTDRDPVYIWRRFTEIMFTIMST
jgi:hypothetical protein